jgi:hypothetical protein
MASTANEKTQDSQTIDNSDNSVSNVDNSKSTNLLHKEIIQQNAINKKHLETAQAQLKATNAQSASMQEMSQVLQEILSLLQEQNKLRPNMQAYANHGSMAEILGQAKDGMIDKAGQVLGDMFGLGDMLDFPDRSNRRDRSRRDRARDRLRERQRRQRRTRRPSRTRFGRFMDRVRTAGPSVRQGTRTIFDRARQTASSVAHNPTTQRVIQRTSDVAHDVGRRALQNRHLTGGRGWKGMLLRGGTVALGALGIHNMMDDDNAQEEAIKKLIGDSQPTPATPSDVTAGDAKPLYDIPDIAKLGSVSQSEESTKGVHEISTGRGDHGGVSYGAHQLASNNGSMSKFLNSVEARSFQPDFAGLKPGSAAFNEQYRKVAERDPKAFETAQKAYIFRTHYQPLQERLARDGIDLSGRSRAVQEMVYSTAVQYGTNTSVIRNALKGADTSTMSDEDLVRKVQQYKHDTVGRYFKSSSGSVQDSVARRTMREQEKLLALTAQPEIDLTYSGGTRPEYAPDTATPTPSLATMAVAAAAMEPVVNRSQAVEDLPPEAVPPHEIAAAQTPAPPSTAATAGAMAGLGLTAFAADKLTIPRGSAGSVGRLGKAVPFAGAALGAYDAYSIINDPTMTETEKNRELSGVVGGTVGATGGWAAGSAAGAAVGALFGGVGAVPGAIIGGGLGLVGSWLGYDVGSEIAKSGFDWFSNDTPEERQKREDNSRTVPDVNRSIAAAVASAKKVEEQRAKEEEAQRKEVINSLDTTKADAQTTLQENTGPSFLTQVSNFVTRKVSEASEYATGMYENVKGQAKEVYDKAVVAAEKDVKKAADETLEQAGEVIKVSPSAGVEDVPKPAEVLTTLSVTPAASNASDFKGYTTAKRAESALQTQKTIQQIRQQFMSAVPHLASPVVTSTLAQVNDYVRLAEVNTPVTNVDSVDPKPALPKLSHVMDDVVTSTPVLSPKVMTFGENDTEPKSRSFYETSDAPSATVVPASPGRTSPRVVPAKESVQREKYAPISTTMAIEPKMQETLMPDRFKIEKPRISSKGTSEGGSIRPTIDGAPAVISDSGLVLLQTGFA